MKQLQIAGIPIIISFMAIMLIIGCGTDADKELTEEEFVIMISATEDSLYSKKGMNMDVEKATELLDMYSDFSESFIKSDEVPEMLFKGGELAMGLKKSERSLSFFKRLFKAYPNYEKAPYALFLQGFINENYLGKLGKAEELYRQFMSEYPSHELYKDAKFSIENMGMSPEELLKSFEKQTEAS
ncbi:MAG: tetratricopeptide repeat protein [Flavobacteriales bacterium]|nr:tetratricopeptide repeat protein [Flavobacteriales bacterium]